MIKQAMRVSLGALAVAALLPLSATAQGRGTWVFTPYAGVYVPANDLARLTAEPADLAGAFKVKHQNALALGGTASYWLTERAAVELGGAYAYSHLDGVPVSGAPGSARNERASVMMGSAKFMYALLPSTSDVQLRLGLGPAVVHRGGTAYKEEDGVDVRGLTDVGGAFSLCTRVPLTGRLALRLRAEDYVYRAQLKFRDSADPLSGYSTDRRYQNDLIFSAGLQIRLYR